MRHRSRPVALRLTLAAGALLSLAGAAPAPAPSAVPAGGSDVVVTVVGLRNDRGTLRACMTDAASDFPKCADPRHDVSESIAARNPATLTFHDVAPGRYAIALFHDENNNGRMDRAMLMIPREGFGFSRDAKVRMGPPRFASAAFDVGGGASAHLVIHMRYLF